MSRLRLTLISASMLIALGILGFDSFAQQQGGDRGGGPGGFGKGGRGPGGFFGGFGGPGGPFGSAVGLASNPGVQEELKLKDDQKAKIKSLADRLNEQMRELREQMGFGRRPDQNNNGPGGGQNQAGRNRGDVPQNPNNQGQGNVGQGPPGGGNFGQNGGNFGRTGRGFGGGPPDPETQQRFQMMREATQELQQSAEQSLAKLVGKAPFARIKQIQLQLEGPGALVRDDMAEKLLLDEPQVEMIRELLDEHRQAQREMWTSRRQFFVQARGNNPDPNRANQGGNGGNPGDGANADNGAQRPNRPRFDPEAFRKTMEDPAIQAKMAEFREMDQKLGDQLSIAVNKVLTPRQRNNYKKMIGAPFDRSKLGGPPWAQPGRNGSNQTAATNGNRPASATKGQSSSAKDNENAPAQQQRPAARPRRKSLRELRGIGESKPED
jgi:hypothetical protein